MFTVVYYFLLLVLVTIFLVATIVAWVLTVPFDRGRRVVHEISRGIAQLFFRLPPAWHTTVRGLEHVDRRATYVIVLNHSAMVDIPMLYWVPLNFRWVSRSGILKIPFIGAFMLLHGDILIPRDKPRRAAAMMMIRGRRWLQERRTSVAIFPEGTRSKTGEPGRFKSGAFVLAKEAGVGILPVVLTGSRVIGKNGRLPWHHRFTVTVLPPVPPEEVATRDPKDIMEETRERMVSRVMNYEL
jgi:1-acyl-sn-glycerol-3-phosphate acyltransferase